MVERRTTAHRAHTCGLFHCDSWGRPSEGAALFLGLQRPTQVDVPRCQVRLEATENGWGLGGAGRATDRSRLYGLSDLLYTYLLRL